MDLEVDWKHRIDIKGAREHYFNLMAPLFVTCLYFKTIPCRALTISHLKTIFSEERENYLLD